MSREPGPQSAAAASPLSRLERFFTERLPAAVLSAYVFGSHAEGRPHRESDLDVAVLLDPAGIGTRAARAEFRVELISELIAATGENRIDLVILDDAPPELARRIVTRGRRLFTRDPAADRAFVRDAQLRAADVVPWLVRMRRIKLESLRR